MNNWPTPADVKSFYGNPDANGDGVPNRDWEDSHLVGLTPPFTLCLAWDVSKTVKTIRVNKLVKASLERVLGVIWAHHGHSQSKIEEERLHLYGGAYNFRLTRGGATLSMHSYGCAIDLDPENNRMGRMWRGGMGMVSKETVKAFRDEGWYWGGDFSRPDAMHFEAVKR